MWLKTNTTGVTTAVTPDACGVAASQLTFRGVMSSATAWRRHAGRAWAARLLGRFQATGGTSAARPAPDPTRPPDPAFAGDFLRRLRLAQASRKAAASASVAAWRTPMTTEVGVPLDRLLTADGSSPAFGVRLYRLDRKGRRIHHSITVGLQAKLWGRLRGVPGDGEANPAFVEWLMGLPEGWLTV